MDRRTEVSRRLSVRRFPSARTLAMSRESLRVHYPSSYDEEMEQLRAALEISARMSTEEKSNPAVTTSSTTRAHVTNERRSNAALSSARTERRGTSVRVSGDASTAIHGADERSKLIARLQRRYSVSERDAARVINSLDGDGQRVEDVCLMVSTVQTTVDRAIAYLRDAGWDVELAMARILDATKKSMSAEEEREQLKRRAESMRRVGSMREDDDKTVKQNLNASNLGAPPTQSGFSGTSYRTPPLAHERDVEAEQYQRSRWESEFAERAQRATMAKSAWDSHDESIPASASMPQTGPSPSPEPGRAEPAPAPVPPPKPHSEPPSVLDLKALERQTLVDLLTVLGVPPSSSAATAVRSAFRKAALRFHPDRLAGAHDAKYRSDVWKLLTSKMDAYDSA